MTPQLRKSFNMANMTMGIGILLTIIPLGLSLVMIIGSQDDPVVMARVALGWAFFVVCGLLPLGLALFVGGLSWILVIKRRAKASDLDEDEKEAVQDAAADSSGTV